MKLPGILFFKGSHTHSNIQNVKLQPDSGFVLGEDLDAVDMAEVCQQGHQVGPGVDDVTDSKTRTHQQHHLSLFLTLLQQGVHEKC